MNKQQLKQDIQELETKLAQMRSELDKPEKYEIEYEKGNTYIVDVFKIVSGCDGEPKTFLYNGRYRRTKKFANLHKEGEDKRNRLGALVEDVTIKLGMEDWEADWNHQTQSKYSISYNHSRKEWIYSSSWLGENIEIIYMPEEVAIRVCEILNNGEYDVL